MRRLYNTFIVTIIRSYLNFVNRFAQITFIKTYFPRAISKLFDEKFQVRLQDTLSLKSFKNHLN
jgi:hypothetical protein